MKNLITFILTLMTLQFVQSQEYKPFDLDNGEWYCRYVTKGGMFGGGHDTYYATDTVKFFCSGDTIINDTLYKKLYYEGYTSSQIVPRTYISGYLGAIRNDTVSKRVWLYDSFYSLTSSSYIIYDFNLIQGDSICNDVLFPMPITFYFCGKVESIDSVNYCNKYFRRYNTESNQSIIEGIGSDKGLLPIGSGLWNSNLLCYREKNNSNCESCDIISTNIANLPINENTINVYQETNQLHISSEHLMESIDLVDLSGRYIIRLHSIKRNSTDLFIAQKGIYILRVKIDDKILSRKIILK
ncbi:MAG: T9SS type A sorting domain-containing protein [Mariniphaga sp.]|nr:T9SS type A sorting domain-containing protein [Mariniphaga sp.]